MPKNAMFAVNFCENTISCSLLTYFDIFSTAHVSGHVTSSDEFYWRSMHSAKYRHRLIGDGGLCSVAIVVEKYLYV